MFFYCIDLIPHYDKDMSKINIQCRRGNCNAKTTLHTLNFRNGTNGMHIERGWVLLKDDIVKAPEDSYFFYFCPDCAKEATRELTKTL